MSQIHKLQRERRTLDELTADEQTKTGQFEMEELLAYWMVMTAIQSQALEVIRTRLPETAVLVESSTQDLNEKFRELALGAKSQGEQVQQIVDMAHKLDVGGEQITLSEFNELFNNTLSESIQRILYVSKMAMSMVYSLDDAINSLTDIENFVGRIQKINKQTNLLALNATIEASRAGDSGKGFDVVAGEVKTISHEISALASTMQEKVNLVTTSIRKGYDTLRDVATTDMSSSIMGKEKLDSLMASMLEQNTRFTGTLQEAANTSKHISGTINSMVMGMQFQDRTTQNIENCVNVLANVQENWTKLNHSCAKMIQVPVGRTGIEPDLIKEINQQFKLGTFRNAFLAHLSSAGIIENVETYGGSPVAVSDSSVERKEHGATTNDDDNIELF